MIDEPAPAQTAADPFWIVDFPWLARPADILAVAVAVSLPWSTSVTSILAVIWLIAVMLAYDIRAHCKGFMLPAGGVPVALWLLAVIGLLWTQAGFADQLVGLEGLHKLLVIPFCIVQFRRSDKGTWVLAGFLTSSTVLLAVSWVVWVWPELSNGPAFGVPVKDYIVQSGEFTICAFALTHMAFDALKKRRTWVALGCAALATVFLINMAFVATARTSILVYVVLAGLLGFQRFGWKGCGVFLLIAGILGTGVLLSSSYLQERLGSTDLDIVRYETENAQTSTGLRLEFWKKSIRFIAESPMIGHGTGSIGPLFRQAAVGDESVATGTMTLNVHNMTLQIGVQLGLLGVGMLYAVWLAHMWLFIGAPGSLHEPASRLAAMIGAAVVLQNAVGSLFLAYLIDFSTGWLYILGVGVTAGMIMRDRDAQAARQP